MLPVPVSNNNHPLSNTLWRKEAISNFGRGPEDFCGGMKEIRFSDGVGMGWWKKSGNLWWGVIKINLSVVGNAALNYYKWEKFC